MITESYSEERESLFSPGAFFGERKYICDTAIITFSGEIFQAVIDRYPHREVAYIGSANGRKPIYAIEINGKEIVFYLSSIGACLAGTEIIEMEWQTGVKSLIVFGSCGALDSEATNGKYIVPRWTWRRTLNSRESSRRSSLRIWAPPDRMAGRSRWSVVPDVRYRFCSI